MPRIITDFCPDCKLPWDLCACSRVIVESHWLEDHSEDEEMILQDLTESLYDTHYPEDDEGEEEDWWKKYDLQTDIDIQLFPDNDFPIGLAESGDH